MLANEMATSKEQWSKPITEEELREPWTNEELRGLGEYASRPKCDDEITRWLRKAATEAENCQLKNQQHNKDTKDYNHRIEKGEKKKGLKRPVMKQASLMVA